MTDAKLLSCSGVGLLRMCSRLQLLPHTPCHGHTSVRSAPQRCSTSKERRRTSTIFGTSSRAVARVPSLYIHLYLASFSRKADSSLTLVTFVVIQDCWFPNSGCSYNNHSCSEVEHCIGLIVPKKVVERFSVPRVPSRDTGTHFLSVLKLMMIRSYMMNCHPCCL